MIGLSSHRVLLLPDEPDVVRERLVRALREDATAWLCVWFDEVARFRGTVGDGEFRLSRRARRTARFPPIVTLSGRLTPEEGGGTRISLSVSLSAWFVCLSCVWFVLLFGLLVCLSFMEGPPVEGGTYIVFAVGACVPLFVHLPLIWVAEVPFQLVALERILKGEFR